MTEKKEIKWKNTLNLPQTEFSMKANLNHNEPKIIEKWDKENIYQKILDKRKDADKYTLHDGPPYANGHIHLGHALNKILKDFIVKSKSMEGFYTPYVPGWDCHGLPIEIKVDQQLGSKKKEMTIAQIRTKCREYAEKYIKIQKEEFKRLGVMGEWNNPYTTLDHYYESAIIDYLKSFVKNKNIIRKKRPVYWCASCQTALAEAEVKYQDKTSPSIYVKFLLKDKPALFSDYQDKEIHVLIWTTTPWTIPANLAIAVHPDFEYALFQIKDQYWVCATRLIPVISSILDLQYKILKKFSGQELSGLITQHPLYPKRESIIILTDYATLEQGTGCVHTAPGHGEDDYLAGIQYNLDIYSPVNAQGKFDSTAGKYEGMDIFKANSIISNDLKENQALIHQGKTQHSYPHCWRCKKPIIFRATKQWFIDIDLAGLRNKALEEIKKVKWFPKWGEERIYAMVKDRPRWCISRQRNWGVPIPVFYCKSCNHPLLTEESIEKVGEIFRKHGSDSWYTLETSEFIKENTTCEKCHNKEFTKGMDILDVWFESGGSYNVLFHYPHHKYPADMYIEGGDQYRGWFQSSLLLGISSKNEVPYKTVITHGWALDKDGKAMSKSLGNVINPLKIIQSNGAEILRLWAAMVNYREDVRLGKEIIKRVIETYRKIRNTWRFMFGVLSDFSPEKDRVEIKDFTETDLYILNRLQEVKGKLLEAYNKYEYHIVFHTISNFFSNELSSFYLNLTKDTLYCENKDNEARRAIQTVIFELLKDTLLLMAPILSFTAEEGWEYLPNFAGKETSIHIHQFPSVKKEYQQNQDDKKWEKIFLIREEIQKEMEIAIKEKQIIRDNLQADIMIQAPGKEYQFLKENSFLLKNTLSIPKLTLKESKTKKIIIKDFKVNKCPRCWNRFAEEPHQYDLCDRCFAVTKELDLEQV